VGALILILALAAITNNFIGEFMFFRGLGILDAYFAAVLGGAFNLAFVLPLAYLARLRNPNPVSFTGLVKAMAPYFIAFYGLFIAITWVNITPQMIHMFSRGSMGIPVIFRDAAFTIGGEPTVGMILAVALPVLAITAITGFAFVKADRLVNGVT